MDNIQRDLDSLSIVVSKHLLVKFSEDLLS